LRNPYRKAIISEAPSRKKHTIPNQNQKCAHVPAFSIESQPGHHVMIIPRFGYAL
jgi:hypothetical protein